MHAEQTGIDAAAAIPFASVSCTSGHHRYGVIDRTVSETSAGVAPARIALLTPYDGGNLGDGAIQDAMLLNLSRMLPNAEFAGISLNCENFASRHRAAAFPLCAMDLPFYGMRRGAVQHREHFSGPPGTASASLKQRLLSWRIIKRILTPIRILLAECRHSRNAYNLLRTQTLLIVSGGGQLDEEWGGWRGHPYSLFKWALLARLARVPLAVASVGACKIESAPARGLIWTALRLARYRSYRDGASRRIVAKFFSAGEHDPIVPDLAFSLPAVSSSAYAKPVPKSDRRTIAVSLIAYAKPGHWPSQDAEVFRRYSSEMATVVSQLLQRGFCITLVSTSLGDDTTVIPEVLAALDRTTRETLCSHVTVPEIGGWQDFVAAIGEADVLIASRLHSTILGLVTGLPTVAISFDPKVDRVMQDVGLSEYLLNIRRFGADDVLALVERATQDRKSVLDRIASYRQCAAELMNAQFYSLAALASASNRT